MLRKKEIPKLITDSHTIDVRKLETFLIKECNKSITRNEDLSVQLPERAAAGGKVTAFKVTLNYIRTHLQNSK